ncbi:hypothetical protein LPJ79_005650 [Coemansia sp. RSA 1821]|nr:hypothetical protein LPJ79_005650 [Coemansia sp. RSA 1821]KAJ2672604.1 hypothetical protein IWW42_002758 [Coemansia sp. RSA 1085]
MAKDKDVLELKALSSRRETEQLQQIDLPQIDTSIRRTNMGGSHSMPPSPTSGLMSSQPIARHPSNPHTAADLSLLHQTATTHSGAAPRASFVQSGRMTKIPHYGRIRSVTARVLRMMDPRTLAQQRRQQTEERGGSGAAAAGGNSGSAQVEDSSYGGTAAGMLGRSVVDTMRDAAAAGRRRRRYSHGSVPAAIGGLSRHASRESQHDCSRLRMSIDERRQPRRSEDRLHAAQWLSRQSSRISERTGLVGSAGSRTPSMHSMAAPNAEAAESIISIPMPGFFLDPASDDWTGGHSFLQRMRYPEEVITVPASLTKRVHYEVSYDYPKNVISTARYNVVTFLPAQLLAQFSKVANVYFLFIAALQQVPGWSTTGRWTTILPLSVFVSLSIAHEGFDDFRRHRMDHAENSQRTRVLKVKVHDRERLSFSFRELRHRGSQSIHSFRMRSSQSIHDIGRNTLESARRWAVSAISIGSTIKDTIGKRLAEKRRKKRELEDSDDEDEQPGGAEVFEGDESLLRRQITRGVMSLRSWRGAPPSVRPGQSTNNDLDTPLAEGSAVGDDYMGAVPSASDLGSLAMTRASRYFHQRQASRLGGASLAGSEMLGSRRGPMVAFNDVVEEVSYEQDDEAQANPLPENMSCRWKKKRWENVQVGDLLMICKDEWIPADCVVIASTGFDGTCFVETASLDGETTLKQKQALEVTNSEIQTAEQLAAFNAFTHVEPPSSELYGFEGFMEIGGERYPLTPNQLLLRGSVLRNTAYVFAQVVYSGEQTRLRLNATRNVRTKAPQIQRITNRIVIFVFILLLVLCFVFAGLGIHWNNDNRQGHWYLSTVHMPATALIFGYIVMMNALIPISLYVTLEAVKIFQCWFIQQDVGMYHPDSDTRAEARTTAINEDLGMVRYVFSDKTGTLTENIMKLRAVMVAGFSYLHIDLDRLKESPAQKSEPVEDAKEQDSSQLSGSRMSFLRSAGPASPTGSNSGRQSPSLFRTQLFAKHRRQHSMPSPTQTSSTPQSPRHLQHLAAANRASAAGHSRGMSVSVLRSPPAVSSGLQHEMQPFSEQQQQQQVCENAPLLGDEASESSSDVDPDIISSGAPGDPRMHTKASDDAPVSDLQALPSSRLIMDGQTPPTAVFRARAEWFLRCMALCHTVQPDRDPLTGRITGYQATSPDEKALVAAAAELGFVMNNRAGPLVQLRVVASERMRDFNQAVINDIKSGYQSPAPTTPVTASTAVPLSAAGMPSRPVSAADSDSPPATAVAGGEPATRAAEDDSDAAAAESEQSFDRGVPAPHPTDRLGNYEVLDVLEFSSARKRMSVILRCPDGRIIMMSKGADSAIWPRLCSISQLQSDPSDVSFMPRPTPPADKFAAPQPLLLRRKLSQPSAAYLLHSRNASVASSTQSRDGEAMPESAGLTYPPKAVARLNDGTMYFGQLGESSSPGMPSPLADETTDDLAPMSAPANSTFATMRQAPQHRRLMSDSQFSALSEASSFADTQGQIEISPSFQMPTAQEEEWARARALEALHQFSTEGLRTLAYAHKEIPEATYEAWHTRYLAATTALNNRQEQVEAVCEEIEGDLLLSGVSAIEDRLQEGVPETIFKLRRAGIRVWMLTGDKVETAVNIAKSCRLIETDVVETTSLDPQTVEKCKDKMLLLVMQSLSDPDALERTITRALDVARTIGASVDQRFERRSRREKLRRGLKKFGNMLMLRRSRLQDAETQDLIADTDLKRSEQQQRATEIGWAEDVHSTTPALGFVARGTEPQQQEPSLSGSSATSRPSDVTRGVASKKGSKDYSPAGSDAGTGASLAVVVDGETLGLLESHPALLDRFLSLGTLCDAVICSRVSPSQKALIVHNMRVRCEGGGSSRRRKSQRPWLRYLWSPLTSLFTHDNDRYMVTLAIGDGGNDIAMIQEAHVGIGIAGQEGLQASRAADFSIGQFRFLQRLLLVHGRWSYVRVSMFIMGTFYKCMAFYVTQLIYQFYTGFSGTSLFENWTLSMYNTLFSILPVLVVGIFEQDLKPETLLTYPELYRDMGPSNHLFTVPEFIRRVVVIGILHSIVAAYFPIAGGLLLGYNGTTNDQFINGLMIYCIMVLIVTLKIAYIDVRRWVVFSHISVVLSLALWFGWNGVLNHIYPDSPGEGYFVQGVFDMLMSKATFWFQWIIFTAVALCLNVLILIVYSIRDPVEHRITSWVAFERRKEHLANKYRRKQWLADHNIKPSWM